MTQAECLECLMLASFTAGWYWSIASMLRSREPYGKSAPFVACTVIGYVFGLTAKVLASQQNGVLSDVAFVYVWNLTLTAIDLVLVVYYSRQSRDRIADSTNRTVEQSRARIHEAELPAKPRLRQARSSTDEGHDTMPIPAAPIYQSSDRMSG